MAWGGTLEHLTLGLWLGLRVQELGARAQPAGRPLPWGWGQAATCWDVCLFIHCLVIQGTQCFSKHLYCGRSRPGSGAEKPWPSRSL